MVIVSIIPTIIICFIFRLSPFHFESLLNWKLWLLAIVTVLITSFFIQLKHDLFNEDSALTLIIEAACMEIPQRLMMQTLVCGLLAMGQKKELFGILINALIWCGSIIVQAAITKQNNIKNLCLELIASFLFSIGIGYVFFFSECIVIPMIAHASERYITRKIIGK